MAGSSSEDIRTEGAVEENEVYEVESERIHGGPARAYERRAAIVTSTLTFHDAPAEQVLRLFWSSRRVASRHVTLSQPAIAASSHCRHQTRDSFNLNIDHHLTTIEY